MRDFALEQPRHRLQADVRMRRHVHRPPGGEAERAEAIEEAPWPDQAMLTNRQGTADGELTQVQCTRRISVEAALVGAERHARLAGHVVAGGHQGRNAET